MGFSYNHAEDRCGGSGRTRGGPKPNPMTKRILEPSTAGGTRLDFRECSPAYFSGLTLRLTQALAGVRRDRRHHARTVLRHFRAHH
jgi:hypothetical protein